MREPVTFLLLAVVFVGSFCHAQDQAAREEQNRVAVQQIQAGAPVFDTRSPAYRACIFLVGLWESIPGIEQEQKVWNQDGRAP
jgi:hypothetical protein